MNYLKLNFLLLVSLLLVACGTSIPITVDKAPLIEMGGVKKVSVKQFQVSGYKDLMYPNRSVVDHVAEIVDRAQGIPKAYKQDLRYRFKNSLESAIMSQGQLGVVSYNSREDAKIKGQISFDVRDQGEWVERQDASGNLVTRFKIRRKAIVTINFEVKSMLNGRILGGGTVKRSAQDSEEDINEEFALNRLDSWESLVFKATSQTYGEILRYIVPYKETYRVKLLEGEDPRLEEGADAADDGDWSQAKKLWKSILGEASPEDQAKASHNLGVMFEARGRYGKAKKWYQSSLDTYFLEAASQGYSRANQAQLDRKKLKQQIKPQQPQPQVTPESPEAPKSQEIHKVPDPEIGF